MYEFYGSAKGIEMSIAEVICLGAVMVVSFVAGVGVGVFL